jgi:hypothetical protein
MPIDRTIAQLLVILDRSGPTVVAKSDGVPFAWENAANTAVVRYGLSNLPGTATFAVPLGKSHVSIANVTSIHDTLAFRFLLMHRKCYDVLGDPFQIADEFPPDWSARGALPLLEWPEKNLPARKVDDLHTILKDGDGPLLLGATQALLDGTRILIQRDAPADALFRQLWQLLPTSSRHEIWPATFAGSADLGFQVAVLPGVPDKLPMGYITEEQTRDYPEGRYELGLQSAIESKNQFELDRLLARRSSQETLRLAVGLLIVALVLALVSKLLF